MSFTEKDFLEFQKRELHPDDTFSFECSMCGDCCRNRQNPILLTGADTFRMSAELGISVEDMLLQNAEVYIGTDSHVPVFILKERLDGSCRLLRNGRCTVHRSKPAACALFPLGRYFDGNDRSFHYFLNPLTCPNSIKPGKTWTLNEWISYFRIKESEEMMASWNRLLGGLVRVTNKMKKKEIDGDLLAVLLLVLYFGYETDKNYYQQIDANMDFAAAFFKEKFGVDLHFE